MKNKEYVAPQFGVVSIDTKDIMTASVVVGFDNLDNWVGDPF